MMDLDDDIANLLEKKQPTMKKDSPIPRSSDNNSDHVPVGFAFSIRKLAYVNLAFLLVSHALLARQCVVASTKQSLAAKPIVRQYRVTTKHTDLEIRKSAKKSGSTIDMVSPGDIVDVFGEGTSDFHFLIEPAHGFVMKTSPNTGLDYFEELEDVPETPSFCPLMYEGWWPEGERAKTYLYAPTPLVVAQQLWNAMQVFQLFLLLALGYEFSQPNAEVDESARKWRKVGVRLLSVVSILLLPFAVYLISPGGHMFAAIAFTVQMLAIFTPVSTLRLSIGENESEARGDADSPAWTLSREESIACICNLCSSLYNYAGSIRVWPHWKRHMYNIDDYFGWVKSGDCSVDEDFTMGFSDMHVPLFVARSSGTTTGAQLFLLLWSVIPFLYVSYFGCMFVLAPRSPGVKIQRAFCLFGMCHFLFFTDVVAYRYGRGYHSPHGELCHWLEKWAWRTAMLMPIYQNCTNGHWERGHRSVPMLGKLLRYILIPWSIFFVIFQILQSDVLKFSLFLMGKKQKGLIDLLELQHAPVLSHLRYPYRYALVTMWIMYGLLHVLCFTHYRIFLRRDDQNFTESSFNDSSGDLTALLSQNDSEDGDGREYRSALLGDSSSDSSSASASDSDSAEGDEEDTQPILARV